MSLPGKVLPTKLQSVGKATDLPCVGGEGGYIFL
jgi:hypothetical protein